MWLVNVAICTGTIVMDVVLLKTTNRSEKTELKVKWKFLSWCKIHVFCCGLVYLVTYKNTPTDSVTVSLIAVFLSQIVKCVLGLQCITLSSYNLVQGTGTSGQSC